MLKSKFVKIVIAVCGISLAFAGCSSSDDEDRSSALRSGDNILKYVPADTPYLFAMPEAMPDEVLDKLESHFDAILDSYQEVIRAMLASARTGMGADNESAEEFEQVSSIAEEIMTLMGSKELRAAGIPRNPRAAIYGVGLLPVLRIELDDVDAFEKTIAKFEAKSGEPMSEASIGEQDYRYAGDEIARVILAVIDSQFVMTIVPAKLSTELLSEVLGITLPAENIATAGVLEKIAIDYEFTPYALGFIDFERLAATFLDRQDGVNAELRALMKYEDSDLTDVCRAEIRQMSGVAPRFVTGYTEINVEKFESNTVLELRADIAAGITKLAAAVPGLGMDHGGLFSFGMSIDLLAAREFYAARLDALEADPYKCPSFGEFQEGIAAGRDILNQPIPPIAYDLKGFLAVVENIEGFDFARQQPPTDVDMALLIATDNGEGLLAMGSMFSAELAELNLQPDGKPVKLEVALIADQFESAFIGMSDNALGIAVGENAESRLAKLLTAKPGDPLPSFSIQMDAASYYDLVGESMMSKSAMAGENVDAVEVPMEVKAAVGDVMKELGKLINRVSVDIYLTERGIEFPTTVTLAE